MGERVGVEEDLCRVPGLLAAQRLRRLGFQPPPFISASSRRRLPETLERAEKVREEGKGEDEVAPDKKEGARAKILPAATVHGDGVGASTAGDAGRPLPADDGRSATQGREQGKNERK